MGAAPFDPLAKGNMFFPLLWPGPGSRRRVLGPDEEIVFAFTERRYVSPVATAFMWGWQRYGRRLRREARRRNT